MLVKSKYDKEPGIIVDTDFSPTMPIRVYYKHNHEFSCYHGKSDLEIVSRYKRKSIHRLLSSFSQGIFVGYILSGLI